MSKPPLVRINLYSHLSQPCSNLTIIKLRLSTTWDGISYDPLIFQTFDIWHTFLTRWLWYITYMSFSAKLLTMNSKECIFKKKIWWIFPCSYVLHKKPLPHMLLRTTLQVCCLPKENANNRDHNIMHDLGKSPRFKILYNLNLKNSVTYLKNNSSSIFSIPENDGLQSTDLAHYNPP